MSSRAKHVSRAVDVAEDVRNFYDRYPYPAPVESLDAYRRHWADPQRRRVDFHLFWPHRPYREDHSILIAGCGTSQAAKHAMRWPSAQVIGIDCSATSVRCTERLKRKYCLSNLQVRQLDVERVGELRAGFDQIVCTGVLHHLKDPDKGLAALRSVLNPDGALHLMVYAPYGRTGIYMLQEFYRRLGIRASDEAIRDLSTSLAELPAGHPLESVLSQALDFRHEAAIADALLHPQDRAYSVDQLFAFLAKAGLVFGRWLRQAPYSLQCGVAAKLPHTTRMAALSPPAQYAAIELFRGTMARHSVVAYRNDNTAGLKPIDFSGPAWLDYVPIRMPGTISVQERLPHGVAAVLINKTHTDRDLFLPIGAEDKRLFDAIDGHRTIREIVATTPSHRQTNIDAARTFFEKLWWHDQLVFDASC
jgi:SAM-dependent methyltransferase